MSPKLLVENKNYPYAVISRDILWDERLSWAARGVMAYILSYDNDGEYPLNIYSVVCCTKGNSTHESTENIEEILKELNDAGYIEINGREEFTDY